jgi:hypothetical protein
VKAAREEASAIRAAACRGHDLLAERRAAAVAAAERRRADALRGMPVAELLDGWRATLEAVIADKAARGEAQGYERELLRLEARTIRPEIGTERAGKLDPERFQALVLLQPTVNHARNLRNALARFTKWANAETTRRGAPLKWPTAFAVEGRPRSRKHRFTIEEAARLWIGAGTLGRRGAMVRCMLLGVSAERGGVHGMGAPSSARCGARAVLGAAGAPYQEQGAAPRAAGGAGGGDAALAAAARDQKGRTRGPGLRRARQHDGGRLDAYPTRAAGICGRDTGTLHDSRRTIVSALGDQASTRRWPISC